MATDPFDGIKRPISGEFVEIGQPTFAELIWAQRCVTSPAIGRSVPDVRTSLRELAFGDRCVDRLRPRTVDVGSFSATIPPGGTPEAGFAYDVRALDKGGSYKRKVKNLGAAKESSEFRGLVTNTFDADATKQALFEVLTGCPHPCADPCVAGEDDVCAVDFVVVLDDTGSMRGPINAVKTGIIQVANLLESTIGFNYRFSLVTFKDNVTCRVPFSDLCGRDSYNAFQNAVNSVTANGGGDWPEFSAGAVKYSADGNCGCWREGEVVRAMVLITDAPNRGIPVTTAASAAASCGIRIAYAGTPGDADEGAIYAATTGGVNVRLGSGGSGLASLLQTFIFTLCAEFIPDPECEGGTNLALNGTFETDINGWDTTGTVVWDEDYESPSAADPILRSIRLNKGATASQTYTDLEAGSLILLNYNWCLRTDLGGLSAAALKAAALPKQSAAEVSFACGCTRFAKFVEPFIINPGEDPETGFPAVGKLGAVGGGGVIDYFCTGTLIAPRFILTAAHCVDEGIADDAIRIDFDGTVYSSVKINIHPFWNPTLLNTDAAYDIAIIELDTDVTGITPLGISSFSGAPTTGPEPAIGDPVKIVGFGYTGDDSGPDTATFGVKRSGDQTIDEVTTQLMRYIFDVSGESSAVFGDSGGPVLYEDSGTWYIAALVSGGTIAGGAPLGGIGTTVFNTRVSAFDTWIFGVLSGETQTIIGELRDSSDNPLEILEGSGETSYEAMPGDCSTDRDLRAPVRVRVPLDGIVTAHFELVGAATPNTHWLNIDQIVVCILANEDCGPGARNLIRNGNFENGVQEWTDAAGTALPVTDPSIWDNDIFAIIVNLTAYDEVRQRITNLVPGRDLQLSFEIASHEPDVISELELEWGVLNDAGSIIASGSETNATIQPTPKRITLDFTVPSDGIAQIFITTGTPVGGIAKIRNVLLCDLSGVCEEGYERVSYDEFETDRGSWSGGNYVALTQDINITPDAPNITQTFPGLTPGSVFQLSVNVKFSGGVIINLISNEEVGQLITPTSPGYYTVEVTVQESGIVVADIALLDPENPGASNFLDDILTCVSLPEPCDGSVSDMQVLVEWNGTARQPVNFFNAIVRYTIRDWDDPFDITEETYIPTSEGRLSIAACDLWKSQIASGDVLGSSLANIGEIDDGDFASVAARTDWLWNIPQNNPAPVQDSLTINFPDPGPGKLIESVQVFFLANNAIPATGTDTPPVYPPPLACDPDPASEFNIVIRYINSQGLNREFSVPFAKNDVWVQEANFGVGNPWDTDSATGNGIKGSSARWESVQFDLDTVDNRGLDQCTTPIFFRAEGSGDLVFKEFFLNGTGIFVDPCDSEVLVEDISSSDSANEIQSIVLPNPTGGTWDLSWTREDVTETINLPWNTTAAQIRNRLATMSIIGSTDNVAVSGTGTSADPFLVEFTNDLGATNWQLMEGDGSGLTGAGAAFVTTEANGTPNEQQTISNPSRDPADLIVTFAGATSIPIPFRSTLNEVESALNGISTIGAGNVSVTGNITDRDAAYPGPYRVEFINDLGSQNVLEMEAAPASYEVATDWNGGPGGGKNETQNLNVNAFGGTFTVRVFGVDTTTDCTVTVTEEQAGWPPPPPGSTAPEQEEIQRINIDGTAESGKWQISAVWSDYTGGYPAVPKTGTTAELNYDATPPEVKTALEAIGLLVSSVAGSPGSYYTITTPSSMGNVADYVVTHDLEYTAPGATADTAPIDYNASSDTVKSAIVTAASFITTDDITITSLIADEVTGEFVWEAVFKGAYARTDMPQMQMNAAGLAGAPVLIEEVQAGFGAEDRQRVTVLRASAGSWTLTVTIDGEDYTTTPIPWNTTPIGLQAQLIALPPFEEGDVAVTNLPKTSPEQNLRVQVIFHKKFGNLPLMVPDYEETLLCDPIILPPVDPGPYPYPIPDCDELEDDLRCSSGPLLCRPGEGDEPIALDPCCDEDTIPDRVNVSTRIKFERDLFDPNNPPRTIRDLALIKGLSPSNYTPYIRNFNDGRLTETSWDIVVATKMSILLVENELDTTNGRRRIMNHIAGHREILPARFVWPDCDVSDERLDLAENCWPGVSGS